MTAGSLAGSVMVLFWAAGLWTVLGYVLDVINDSFNTAISYIPMLQDAVDAFSLLGWAWDAIMVIIFFAVILNHVMNQAEASGGVQ